MYVIVLRTSATKELRKLPSPIRQQIIILIDSLASDPRPHGVKKMAGVEAWRIRFGDYRVIFSIQDTRLLIEIIKIGNRRDVYR
ncbi:type II toxin-antitoxin system RelE/ParE family toxin [Candidatus Saccharibacteria bacterium]|nr:type II toxin-antitoxin system RelE/ParE family toxin [Candidatus Saccharibacteria bacterium]